jgi:hypothetical protein
MLSKKYTLTAIASLAAVFCPLVASADQAQVNSQNSSNSAAAVGTNNTVIQNTEQTSFQDQVDVNKYRKSAGSDPQLQINQQNSSNSAAAIGQGNGVVQNTEQFSGQMQEKIKNRRR